MMRKLTPFVLVFLLILSGFLGVKYFGYQSKIQNRDRQIVSLMQASCDVKSLLENDSVQAYIIDVLGDSVFANRVTALNVKTVYRDSIIYIVDTVFRDRIVYREKVIKVPDSRYFVVKSKSDFKGTQEEFEMYKDSMNVYKNTLFSLRASFDSLMYEHGIIQDDLMTKDLMQQEFDAQLADANIHIDDLQYKISQYKAQKDSLEETILSFYNTKKFKRLRKKEAKSNNNLALGAALGAGMGATLSDGEVVIGPNISLSIGIVKPLKR